MSRGSRLPASVNRVPFSPGSQVWSSQMRPVARPMAAAHFLPATIFAASEGGTFVKLPGEKFSVNQSLRPSEPVVAEQRRLAVPQFASRVNLVFLDGRPQQLRIIPGTRVGPISRGSGAQLRTQAFLDSRPWRFKGFQLTSPRRYSQRPCRRHTICICLYGKCSAKQ